MKRSIEAETKSCSAEKVTLFCTVTYFILQIFSVNLVHSLKNKWAANQLHCLCFSIIMGASEEPLTIL